MYPCEVSASLPVALTMAGMSPQGRKYDDLVAKMGAAWEPVVQQMADDQAMGEDGRVSLVNKVAGVFKNKFYWDSPALPTRRCRAQELRAMGTVIC